MAVQRHEKPRHYLRRNIWARGVVDQHQRRSVCGQRLERQRNGLLAGLAAMDQAHAFEARECCRSHFISAGWDGNHQGVRARG